MLDPKNVINLTAGVVADPEIINDKIKEHKILQLNIDKTRKVLKWKPVLNLEETIKETVFPIGLFRFMSI